MPNLGAAATGHSFEWCSYAVDRSTSSLARTNGLAAVRRFRLRPEGG
jgi:hypothetical protein